LNLFGFRNKTTEKKAKWRLDLLLQKETETALTSNQKERKKRKHSRASAGALPCSSAACWPRAGHGLGGGRRILAISAASSLSLLAAWRLPRLSTGRAQATG
jgi:hypothetical protein